MKSLTFLLLLFFLIFLSCTKKESHPYTFYYWKTRLALDSKEKEVLDRASVPYLYTRFFDIDKINGKFQPVGTVTMTKSFRTDKKIIPVVFITNRTFLYIKKEDIRFLAQSVNDLIRKKISQYDLKTNHEIQIDCDWTAGTRDDYFNFLKALKTISGKDITCTLRLHQVKDKSLTGVPPVEKVYLMCYSTSSPLDHSDKNSILDVNTLKSYLDKIDEYPVRHIEVALPIYSWGIVTNYLGKHKLINALSAKDLENTNFKRLSEHEIEIQKDGFYFGNYLNKGFRIKIEEISDQQLKEVIHFLDKKIPHFKIIYYQLDSKFVTGQNFIFQ
ncbi:hypothetical protein MKJ01_01680 [Chryseobacterium sp. SSA4.19]|uniref:hypothetical protein n=1 Tax=Chryseobacterium sp. SSA4.19 TaxID=2919915 RepID=UPI001F4E7DDD|nr:hypothetical protein [Chryseobacterium sp. SSA4.19]MCJ8152470.1 hypothetical protein [Chryseobacterium sp. SSA4.19]